MKRFSSIMMLVAAVAAVSCNKSAQTCEVYSYNAKCPGVEDETRTYLKDGKDVVWAANDAINVLTASNNEKYTLTEGSGTTEGTFSGNPVTGDAYAVYPYKIDATFANGVITTTLSATQNASANGFGNNINLAVAKEDNGTFAFKNVCGLIKFQIKGDNIGKVIISGNNGEDLAGKVNISFNAAGEPVYEVVEGSKTVTIQTHNGAVMTPGTYYAAVLPQTFTKGITITCVPYAFKTNDVIKKVYAPNNLVREGTSEFVLGRASIKPVGCLDKGYAWDYTKTDTILGAIRSNDTAHGFYLDFSTGRAIYPIGAAAYKSVCDLAMANPSNGQISPMSITALGGLTNDTNLGKLGSYDEADDVNNWSGTEKSNNWFAYVTSDQLTDEQFAAIKTVKEIKDIYGPDNTGKVHKYYDNGVTNANRVSDHKFLVIKTYTSAEGTGYGIVKFGALTGNPYYIRLTYKWGLE